MREIFTSGSVGGAPGNQCFYPELDSPAHFGNYCNLMFHHSLLFQSCAVWAAGDTVVLPLTT